VQAGSSRGNPCRMPNSTWSPSYQPVAASSHSRPRQSVPWEYLLQRSLLLVSPLWWLYAPQPSLNRQELLPLVSHCDKAIRIAALRALGRCYSEREEPPLPPTVLPLPLLGPNIPNPNPNPNPDPSSTSMSEAAERLITVTISQVSIPDSGLVSPRGRPPDEAPSSPLSSPKSPHGTRGGVVNRVAAANAAACARQLEDEDLWCRWAAAEALSRLGGSLCRAHVVTTTPTTRRAVRVPEVRPPVHCRRS
jgi:hypothetical protein